MKVPVRIHRCPILFSFRIACVRLLFFDSLHGLFVFIFELSSRIVNMLPLLARIYFLTSSGISPFWKDSRLTIRAFIVVFSP